MSELATVRAEIKTWERSFKSTNGRPPTVDDIRQNPAIADKYKQYKKLSKAAAAPSTPPRNTRHKSTPSLLLSQPRAVLSAAPLASFNPFSPQKKQTGKGKEKAASHANPFASPKKVARQHSPSPEPFPVIQREPSSSSASSSIFALDQPPVPTSAVSRARKRLRGDPVSPSPNKDKRRRVTSQTLPFPRLDLRAPGSEDEEEYVEANSSFVDESPVKAPTNGRSYPKLFDESSLSVDLFGARGSQESKSEEAKAPKTKSKKPVKGSLLKSFPQTASTQEPSNHRTTLKQQQPLNKSAIESEISSNRSSMKRAYSDENDEAIQKPSAGQKLSLIPPSPPPSANSQSFHIAAKKQAKAASNRKKAKVDEKFTEIDSDDLETPKSQEKLRILDSKATRQQHIGTGPEDDDVTSDSDPILAYPRFATPHVPSQTRDLEEDPVEIDLPDELRRVLALQSADSRKQVSEEDRLVKGLLFGRRTTHYDPQKGGEIWDVGEDYEDGGEENVYTEGEDDWEGEPVPWEVGEL
ncbi:hypothetical protein CPB84DRAFT_1760222, partial [Gymnopilus junonius]